MKAESAKKKLEANGYIVEIYDEKNRIYSASTSWDGRTLYGTLNGLVKMIFGY